MIRRTFFAAVLLLGCGGTYGHREVRAKPPPSVEWRVVVGPDLRLDESVCWSGFAPERVVPDSADALRFARVTGEGGPIVVDASGAKVTGASGCVRIAFDLPNAARAMNDESTLAGDGDAVYGSFDAWLWRPKPWPQGMRGKLFVRSPPDISMSVPFHRDESGGYDIPISAWSYMARGAIGKLKREEIDIAGARFSTATLPGTAPSASRQGIRRFIEGAATAVATIDGRMPTDRVQVLLLPGGHGRRTDPVRFGMAMRGGGASVALRISDAASDSHLYGEWIGVHELAHLWLPPIDAESMWLSEGLASYYQCVLRSRTGMYDEAQAWDELVSGFERGRAQAGQTLLEGARRPRYQQIYWGGAAILFKIDVALRRSGTGSLDAAVAAVRRSVSSDDPEAPDAADEMVARLSRAAGRDLQPIVAEALVTPFPDTTTELRELGIVRHGDAIRLDDAAPLAHVRKAIASRR